MDHDGPKPFTQQFIRGVMDMSWIWAERFISINVIDRAGLEVVPFPLEIFVFLFQWYCRLRDSRWSARWCMTFLLSGGVAKRSLVEVVSLEKFAVVHMSLPLMCAPSGTESQLTNVNVFHCCSGKQLNAPTTAFTNPLMVADGTPWTSAFWQGMRTVITLALPSMQSLLIYLDLT